MHPAAGHKRVERLSGDDWEPIGEVLRKQEFLADITRSEGDLAAAVRAGAFAPEHRSHFERIDVVESGDDWAAYLERPATDRFAGDDQAVDAALRELVGGTASLRVVSTYVADAYRRA